MSELCNLSYLEHSLNSVFSICLLLRQIMMTDKLVVPNWNEQYVLFSVSVAMLSLWCEELGRLLLLRHQKQRNGQDQKPVISPYQQSKMAPLPGRG